MESSHKRIVAEMEMKHKEEIERLLREKEVALAEETQATLQALESMRKAHQNEVQREVQRFKQEFLRQFNSDNRDHYDALITQKEEKELEEVRQEILSLSEKYSMKCVEAIALEEKFRNSQQKLCQSHQVIKSLEACTKQHLRVSADDELEQHDSLNSVRKNFTFLFETVSNDHKKF
jgi:myosin phosphatase Rho-interacting protein